ncbi:MAG: hypothetical protein Q9167_003577 [Letrouitia subvulpina]
MFISPSSTKTNANDHIDYNDILSSESKTRKRPITHAVLAVDEPMPEILILPYKKHLQLNPTISLEQNITGVFPSVFRQRGLRPTHTYAFVETPEKPFVSLTYTKPPGASAKGPLVQPTEIPDLRVMLSNLPQLIYLRVGCPSTDSSFLPFIPSTIQTLDVAITDSDPVHVASNLWSMRHHCPQLFTLAIAISPLHDNNRLPNGGRPIDQSSGIGEPGEWEPFWEALRGIQATGVRVCEGEGPGFRNVSRRDNGTSCSG